MWEFFNYFIFPIIPLNWGEKFISILNFICRGIANPFSFIPKTKLLCFESFLKESMFWRKFSIKLSWTFAISGWRIVFKDYPWTILFPKIAWNYWEETFLIFPKLYSSMSSRMKQSYICFLFLSFPRWSFILWWKIVPLLSKQRE